MRLLPFCAAAMLGLVALPPVGRAQTISPADPFSFYFGYIVPRQNQQELSTQRSTLNTINANVANLQAGVQVERALGQGNLPSYLEELDPNAAIGIGRMRAQSRVGAGFGSTRNTRLQTRFGDYYPDRRIGRGANANVPRGGRSTGGYARR